MDNFFKKNETTITEASMELSGGSAKKTKALSLVDVQRSLQQKQLNLSQDKEVSNISIKSAQEEDEEDFTKNDPIDNQY